MNLNNTDLKDQLKIINKHLDSLKNKFDNLYHHLEMGQFAGDDLAPRFKELCLQINDLETRRNVISEEIRSPKTLPFYLK